LPDILAVYSLSEGLTQAAFRAAVESALPALAELEDCLPGELAEAYDLLPYRETILRLHCPRSMEELAKAKRSAAFRELLVFRLALRKMRHAKEGAEAVPMVPMASELLSRLPFTPTGAQQKAIAHIVSDMAKPTPMTRLVQGDVGSGKTVVAAAALELCAKNGMQAVLLAPTEILATQHGEKIDQ
jgi:ATP-dependent DNA helicase RecG